MPSFGEIQKEIHGKDPETPYDLVRRKYMKKLSEKTKRNAILYYSGWLQKPAQAATLMSINDDDKNGFMSVVHGLDTSKGLDLILHTPGGDIAATESLIAYLSRKFGGDLRAIVPQLAMSGGTIIACACREIIMGNQSSLGPIDPQIRGLPASSIVSEFYGANEEMKKDKHMINVWGPVISGYYPSLIDSCKKAIQWSKDLAGFYLSRSMFYDDLRQDGSDAKERIDTIIQLLTDQDITKSHNRHISTLACSEAGLKIFPLERDQDLQDIVLSIHHASALTIANTTAVKITENQDGKAYVSRYSMP